MQLLKEMQMPNPINWSQLIVTSDLEEYFVDKLTGAPLAAGIVTFYEDNNRTVKKPVYQLTGAPGAYSVTPLPNPSTLSGVGTFQDDMGNNIVPYYFPYEGTPTDTNNVVQQYYITVESALGVPEFSREAWPPSVTGGVAPSQTTSLTNFVPNGQFLTHTQITSATQPPTVTIGSEIDQQIAQGGWTFDRSSAGTSTFQNSFIALSGATPGLRDFPMFAFNYKCTAYNSSDTIRDLALSWRGVNTFSAGSTPGTEPYTFIFAGSSNDANTYTVDVRLIQYFGVGGSATTDVSLTTIAISPGFNYYTVPITGFPANAGTIGPNGDDFVRIALRGPNASADILYTDFILLEGTDMLSFFPPDTEAQMLSQSLAGWLPTPNPDGSTIGLMPQLSAPGMNWNLGMVGVVLPYATSNNFSGSLSTITNFIKCDGSVYITSAYSALGIPFSRLQQVLFNSTSNLPEYGTGYNFVSSYTPSNNSAIVRISTNQAGNQTATVDGTPPTGFTFTTLLNGTAGYSINAFINANGSITVMGALRGAVTSATAGTSGFTVAQIYNSPNTAQVFFVTVGVLPGAGTYFTFSNTTTNYYVWFTINGGGADPAPGGTGILVPLLSTYSTADASALIREALNGYESSTVLCGAASTLTGGDNFIFYANSTEYNVWYQVNNTGTAPTSAGTSIKVILTGSENAAQVAAATLLAINSYQFAVPNYKGCFLRGWNSGQPIIPGDPDSGTRFGLNDIYNTDTLGSYQFSTNIEHNHDYFSSNGMANPVGPGTNFQTFDATLLTGYSGYEESRPFNAYVNYVIIY